MSEPLPLILGIINPGLLPLCVGEGSGGPPRKHPHKKDNWRRFKAWWASKEHDEYPGTSS